METNAVASTVAAAERVCPLILIAVVVIILLDTHSVRPRRPHLVTWGSLGNLPRASGIGEYDYVPLV
jgi:hypothetical protein